MSSIRNIRFIQNRDIDKAQWDSLIAASYNQLVYAESVYLDHLCPGWSALISEDEESLMPLPIKSKLGIRYAFQPPFTQQLGIFQMKEDTGSIDSFVEMATQYAPLIDLNFNYANNLAIGKKCCNYILDLSKPFDDLKKKFRKDLISKAETHRLIYDTAHINEAITCYIEEIFPRIKRLPFQAINNFRSLCYHYENTGRVICRKVISRQNEDLGFALFLKDQNRVYGILSATGNKGRQMGANAYLLHEVIHEYSGNQLIFDFEGSEIPGVKFYFEKFAPEPQPYTRVRINKLNLLQKSIYSIRELVRQ